MIWELRRAFRLEWISASEGEKVKTVVNDMVQQLIPLGALNLPQRFLDWDKEMNLLEEEIHTKKKNNKQRRNLFMPKPKIALYWCASCGGCEESVVDLAEDILGVVGNGRYCTLAVAMDFKRKTLKQWQTEKYLRR